MKAGVCDADLSTAKDEQLNFLDMSPTAVTLPNGIELNYVRSGRGPQLIFIHGAMGDWRSWKPQWDVFTQHFDCISYSRRYSFPNGNEMNTRSHNALVDAEDVEAMMDALGLETAILVGSSYGGFTALATALRIPNRIKAVVSVEAPMLKYARLDPEGAQIVDSFLEKSANPARDAFERGENELGVRILTGGIVGRAPEDVPASVMERRMLNMDAARSLALSDDEFPWLAPEELGALPMPILLMTGAETAPVHTATIKHVSAAMPQARFKVIPGSGHSVSQQASELFNQEVMDFLEVSEISVG